MAADIFKRYGAEEVFIFGSAASGEMRKDSDVDFAIKGMPEKNFYRAIGEAMTCLSIPIDVVDLGEDSPFTRYLLTRGNLVRVA